MDWATGDYTQVYADTFVAPEPDHDQGIYLLDEVERESDPNFGAGLSTDPIRSYNIREMSHEGFSRRGDHSDWRESSPGVGFRGRTSFRRGPHPSRQVAWDERPMRSFNPNSGGSDARLTLYPRGPRHIDYPKYPAIIPPAVVSPVNPPATTPLSPFTAGIKDMFGSGGEKRDPNTITIDLQMVKIFLLIVVVVLLAMALVSAGRITKKIEALVHNTVLALKTAKSTA